MINNRRRKLNIYNTVLLLLFFLFFLSKSLFEGTYINWIYWPGGYFGALAILSSFVVSKRPRRISKIYCKSFLILVFEGFVFSILLVFLTDVLILVLERFFRYTEHYTINSLPNFIIHWPRIVEGMFVFTFYQVVVRADQNYHEKALLDQSMNKLQEDFSALSLQSLQTELNPHFLFNAMNSITMMIRVKEYAKSIEMIANLNDLLRVVLSKSHEQLTVLKNELQLLDKYLQIEMVRFGERVLIQKEISEETLQMKVPQLILQPIVENAFKHGMSEDGGQQKISIKTIRQGNLLIMSVFNTTKSKLPIDKSNQERKIGLQNITDRLKKIYGSKFQFHIVQHMDGIEFKISIPF